jgi:hypothetical protein
MSFRPVRLMNLVLGSNDDERPMVLAIEGVPTRHWIRHFEAVDWTIAPTLAATPPKVTSTGIAVPREITETGFDCIRHAIDAANEAERQRVPTPTIEERYRDWFNRTFPDETDARASSHSA